ncbi:glycosyltransferase [Tessaracoccus sp. G1721]
MSGRVVVIIPSLNAEETIGRQLAALDAQTDKDFRVLVSDNGSTDQTRALINRWKPRFTGLELVDSSAKRGAANARNCAIEASDEELVLFCDADDRVWPGWVAAMRLGLESADAVTGPLHLVYPREPSRKEVWNSTALPVSMSFRPYAPSCNFGARRDALIRVGYFDPELDMGQEDVDLGWRLVEAGLHLGHSKDAAIDYYQRDSLSDLIRQQFKSGRAYVVLYEKHRGKAPAPVSVSASVRWFGHWARQVPSAVRRGEARGALAGASFQLARNYEAMRRRILTPL